MNETASQVIKFWIPGSCVPKARPRVTRNSTYLPPRYQQWRKVAQAEILLSLPEVFKAILPIKRAAVQILLQGSHRGDADNLAGSCLDALVSAGILFDDQLNCVPRLIVEHEPKGDRGCWVEVLPLSSS